MRNKLSHQQAYAAAAYYLEKKGSSSNIDEEDLFEEAIDKARRNVLDTRRSHLGRDWSDTIEKVETE